MEKNKLKSLIKILITSEEFQNYEECWSQVLSNVEDLKPASHNEFNIKDNDKDINTLTKKVEKLEKKYKELDKSIEKAIKNDLTNKTKQITKEIRVNLGESLEANSKLILLRNKKIKKLKRYLSDWFLYNLKSNIHKKTDELLDKNLIVGENLKKLIKTKIEQLETEQNIAYYFKWKLTIFIDYIYNEIISKSENKQKLARQDEISIEKLISLVLFITHSFNDELSDDANKNKITLPINISDSLYWSVILGVLINELDDNDEKFMQKVLMILNKTDQDKNFIEQQKNYNTAKVTLFSYVANPSKNHKIFKHSFFRWLIKEFKNQVIEYLLLASEKNNYWLINMWKLINFYKPKMKNYDLSNVNKFFNEYATDIKKNNNIYPLEREVELAAIFLILKIEIYINGKIFMYYPTKKAKVYLSQTPKNGCLPNSKSYHFTGILIDSEIKDKIQSLIKPKNTEIWEEIDLTDDNEEISERVNYNHLTSEDDLQQENDMKNIIDSLLNSKELEEYEEKLMLRNILFKGSDIKTYFNHIDQKYFQYIKNLTKENDKLEKENVDLYKQFDHNIVALISKNSLTNQNKINLKNLLKELKDKIEKNLEKMINNVNYFKLLTLEKIKHENIYINSDVYLIDNNVKSIEKIQNINKEIQNIINKIKNLIMTSNKNKIENTEWLNKIIQGIHNKQNKEILNNQVESKLSNLNYIVDCFKKELSNNFKNMEIKPLPIIKNSDSLYWSVIFSLLIPEINSDESFANKFISLTDKSDKNKQSIKNAKKELKLYLDNPSENHKIFENKIFIELIKKIRHKIANYLETRKNNGWLTVILEDGNVNKKDLDIDSKIKTDALFKKYINGIKGYNNIYAPGTRVELEILSILLKLDVYLNKNLIFTQVDSKTAVHLTETQYYHFNPTIINSEIHEYNKSLSNKIHTESWEEIDLTDDNEEIPVPASYIEFTKNSNQPTNDLTNKNTFKVQTTSAEIHNEAIDHSDGKLNLDNIIAELINEEEEREIEKDGMNEYYENYISKKTIN